MLLSRNILLIALGIFLALGCAATRIIPPFASPDENAHLLRADMLSQGQIFLTPSPENTPKILSGSGGLVDTNFLQFTIQSLQWIFSNEKLAEEVLGGKKIEMPASFMHLRELGEQTKWSGILTFAPASGTNFYNPIIYLPHASALWLGKKMKMSVMGTHNLIRIAVMTLCAVFCALGLRLVAFPPLALAMLVTPMALFQWYSPTIDGLSLSLTVYTMGIFLTEATSLNPPSFIRLIMVSLLALIIATTRTHMLTILVLPIFLAWRQATIKAWILTISVLSSSAAWIIFTMRSTIDTRIIRAQTTADIAGTYLQHPQEFVSLLWRTLTDDALNQFYLQSFMGNLGWLDAPLPLAHITYLYLGLLFFLAISVTPWIERHKHSIINIRLLLLGSSLISMIFSFAALAITWNDYPAQTIQGMQGRYFILPLFLAACALWQPTEGKIIHARFLQHINRWCAFSLVLYFLYSLTVTVTALAVRF